jgi:hypothetical protein
MPACNGAKLQEDIFLEIKNTNSHSKLKRGQIKWEIKHTLSTIELIVHPQTCLFMFLVEEKFPLTTSFLCVQTCEALLLYLYVNGSACAMIPHA